MIAMRLHHLGAVTSSRDPLSLDTIPVPEPDAGEILIKVHCCGVCRTELDEIEGRTPPAELPMTPGHQVIGRVQKVGANVDPKIVGQRVGAAWIHSACGDCSWCTSGLENLCPEFQACGRDAHGGYAEYMRIRAEFAHPVPPVLRDTDAAPLLCAGAVGLRALKLCRLVDGETLAFTGFGASAHLVLQMARHWFPSTRILVFARNPVERDFALKLGAVWSGDTEETPPLTPSAIIDTTPAWKPVLAGMERLAPGGRMVINAIRKESDDQNLLQGLDYTRHLWKEKQLRTVANVTRADVRETLELASRVALTPEVSVYPLEQANQALMELKAGKIRGAKVLTIGQR